MKKQKKNNSSVILLGSGNVATQMGRELKRKGFRILQIYSRQIKQAKILAKELKSEGTSSLEKIKLNADLYIIAVKDDVISQVAKKLHLSNKLVVHTSGSTSMEVFKKTSSRYGVLYPLQTFSKNQKSDWKKIPLCFQANNKSAETQLKKIAFSISGHLIQLDFTKRKHLHLAAVFANNFSNHLFAIAERLLEKNGLSFSLLHPLILETVEKALITGPAKAQTGPALRNDKKTMKKQIQILQSEKQLVKLYKAISKSIRVYKK